MLMLQSGNGEGGEDSTSSSGVGGSSGITSGGATNNGSSDGANVLTHPQGKNKSFVFIFLLGKNIFTSFTNK